VAEAEVVVVVSEGEAEDVGSNHEAVIKWVSQKSGVGHWTRRRSAVEESMRCSYGSGASTFTAVTWT